MSRDKVLIVDDEKLVRWSLRQKCEEWGYQTVEAENGETALKVAHAESPDLVLLDVRLPDLGGLEVLQQGGHHDHRRSAARRREGGAQAGRVRLCRQAD
jgi:CheY-like chemotaxis protein